LKHLILFRWSVSGKINWFKSKWIADRPIAIITGLTQLAYWNQIVGCLRQISRAIIEDLGIVDHLTKLMVTRGESPVSIA